MDFQLPFSLSVLGSLFSPSQEGSDAKKRLIEADVFFFGKPRAVFQGFS
jgi:hypothetical protein